MATLSGRSVVLSTAQTGNGDSTNTAKRLTSSRQAAALVVTTTVGATPTVTVAISGSADGTNFYNIPYCLVATPETIAVANVVITSAVTTTYILRHDHPWKYLKLTYSSNTNVTTTATVYF